MITQISEEIVKLISERLGERNDKGFETYKETLDDVPFENYDWNQMAMEELLDLTQYLMKENFRLKQQLRECNTEMRLNEFQEMSKRTMPNGGVSIDGKMQYSAHNVGNYAMGLAGESGEVIDYLKKVLHHGHAIDRDVFIKECGDVLHYLSGLCTMFDISLEEVATINILKLKKRYPNGFNKKDSIERKDV